MEKKFQFPSDFSNNRGVVPGILEAQASFDNRIKDAFYTPYQVKRKYHLANIEELMICYRYFKETRNCFMHRGGIADEKYISAQDAYKAITREQLAAKEKPKFIEVELGDLAKLEIRGIVGFGDIILKIVKTLETEFICSEGAKNEIIRRWKQRIGKKTMPGDPIKKKRRIKAWLNNCGFLVSGNLDDFTGVLSDNNLVHF